MTDDLTALLIQTKSSKWTKRPWWVSFLYSNTYYSWDCQMEDFFLIRLIYMKLTIRGWIPCWQACCVCLKHEMVVFECMSFRLLFSWLLCHMMFWCFLFSVWRTWLECWGWCRLISGCSWGVASVFLLGRWLRFLHAGTFLVINKEVIVWWLVLEFTYFDPLCPIIAVWKCAVLPLALCRWIKANMTFCSLICLVQDLYKMYYFLFFFLVTCNFACFFFQLLVSSLPVHVFCMLIFSGYFCSDVGLEERDRQYNHPCLRSPYCYNE